MVCWFYQRKSNGNHHLLIFLQGEPHLTSSSYKQGIILKTELCAELTQLKLHLGFDELQDCFTFENCYKAPVRAVAGRPQPWRTLQRFGDGTSPTGCTAPPPPASAGWRGPCAGCPRGRRLRGRPGRCARPARLTTVLPSALPIGLDPPEWVGNKRCIGSNHVIMLNLVFPSLCLMDSYIFTGKSSIKTHLYKIYMINKQAQPFYRQNTCDPGWAIHHYRYNHHHHPANHHHHHHHLPVLFITPKLS